MVRGLGISPLGDLDQAFPLCDPQCPYLRNGYLAAVAALPSKYPGLGCPGGWQRAACWHTGQSRSTILGSGGAELGNGAGGGDRGGQQVGVQPPWLLQQARELSRLTPSVGSPGQPGLFGPVAGRGVARGAASASVTCGTLNCRCHC